MRYDSSQLVIYGYFVAPICQKFWSSCLLVQIDRQDTSKENSNLNHFIVLIVWSLQEGRGKAAPGFLVEYLKGTESTVVIYSSQIPKVLEEILEATNALV